MQYLIFIYVIIILVDIILLIITGVMIIMISRHLQHSEQAKFDIERKWFWIVLELLLIIFVTWPFEIYLWSHRFDLFADTIGDFINLFTAITISIILVGREKARILLFKKYRQMRDIENDAQ